MKNKIALFISNILFIGICLGCSPTIQHLTHGIYADEPGGMDGLYNPERGFRPEVALDVTEKNYVWEPFFNKLRELSKKAILRFAIRCANSDIDWRISADHKYGINIFASLNY